MSERQPDAVVRASSMPAAFDCGLRWKETQLLGKKMPSTPPALIGSAAHAGTAVFDQARMDGVEGCVDDAMDAARDIIAHPQYEIDWNGEKPSDAITIAANLTLSYCNDIAPRYTYVSVETACKPLDIEAKNGTVIRFTGHIDRKRVSGDKFGISDLKTGVRIMRADGTVNTQTSGAQLATYELLEMMDAATSGIESILPAEVIALPTSGKHKPTTATILNPHHVLIGDPARGEKGLIDDLADMLKYDIFPGNPRSTLCHAKYCPIYKTCRYRFQGE
jgi:hypothetical protein